MNVSTRTLPLAMFLAVWSVAVASFTYVSLVSPATGLLFDLSSKIAKTSYLIILVVSASAVFSLGHLAASIVAGRPGTKLSIGLGPEVIAIERGTFVFRIGLFPFGSYLNWEGDEERYASLHPLKKTLLQLAGPVVLIVLAWYVIELGPIDQFKFFYERLPAVMTASTKAWSQAFSFLAVSAISSAFGYVCVWVAFSNLLPLPPLLGGIILMELVTLVKGTHIPAYTERKWMKIGFFIMLTGYGVLLYGLVRHLLN